MKKILILYFSGTGNTRFISENLEKEININGIDSEIQSIVSLLDRYNKAHHIPQDFLASYDHLFVNYPVYAFNPPPPVLKFLKRLPENTISGKRAVKYFNNKRELYGYPIIHLIACPGDPADINDAAFYYPMRILKKKKIPTGFLSKLAMPANVFTEYPLKTGAYLLQSGENFCRTIARLIVQIEGNNSGIKETWIPRIGTEAACLSETGNPGKFISFGNKKIPFHIKILSILFRIEHLGGRFAAKHFFRISADCNQCNLCIAECPSKNIFIKKNRIKFHSNCYFCMHCLYFCPQKAIHMKIFKFFELKNGYSLKKYQEIYKKTLYQDSYSNDNYSDIEKSLCSYIKASKTSINPK